MKCNEIIDEHKNSVQAVKYNVKPKTCIEPQKPRNFVAKNATTSGAGAHADKKKADKQGQVKHKGNGNNASVDKDIDEDAQLTVTKDDDKSTELIDKTTGVTQTIDKTNINAPRLAQDQQGKLMLTKPGGQTTGTDQPPNYMGKTVSVTPEAVAANAASGSQLGDEEDTINTKSVQEDNDILAMIRGIRT